MSLHNLIIVVEDDECTRDVLEELLELEGFRVRSFRTATDALRYLKVIPKACLIILDYLLPDLNGFDFLKQLDSIPQLNDVPVYIITAGNPSTMIPLVRTPQAILKKPLDIEVILSMINKHCGSS